MERKTTFEVEVDAVRNIARLRYFGNVTAADMKACVEQVEGILPQMRAGFEALVDLSGLESMELDCGPHIARIMDLCKARGIRRSVRVIPDPSKDIGLNILSLTHYRGEVQTITCRTLAEAEQALK